MVKKKRSSAQSANSEESECSGNPSTSNQGRQVATGRSAATVDNSSDSDCAQQPTTSQNVQREKEFLEELAQLKGAPKRCRIAVKTTFLKEIEKEPFRFGVGDLPANFSWTEEQPQPRSDYFAPLKPAGDLFKGDKLPVELFLAFHELTLRLLLKAVNETGDEFVESGRLNSFKKVDWQELLRFHSILLYTQVVKMSHLDTYWKMNSIAGQQFVASQMSFKRFKLIKRCIRCYVPSEVRETRQNNPKSSQYHRLYKITSMQNLLLQTYRAHRFPTRKVTIDKSSR